jgi:alpha-1,6-mannosyltransferase
MKKTAAGWLVGALGAGAAVALWTTGPAAADGTWAPAFLRGYLLAWIAYVAAGIVVTRTGGPPRWLVVWVVVVALGMRVICLARTPPLSTDVWRYLWDGRITNAGINPFRHAPDAPEVQQFRDENWGQINFKHIPTIYPPTAELVFAGLARVRDWDAEAFRWTFGMLDVGSVLVVMALLRRTGRGTERAVWYAWNPLAATETTAGSHVDSLGVFLLLAALLLAVRAREGMRAGSGVALGAAVMAKGPAALAAPFFVKAGGWRVLLWFAGACAVLLVPYVGAGRQLFGGLSAYLAGWETNASIFLVVDRALARVTPLHFGVSRLLGGAAVLAFVVWLTQRQREGAEWLIGCTFAALGANLLVGAPVLPWYLLWTLPGLCWWAIPGWVLFSLTASLQYYGRWLYPGDEAAHYALLWAGYLPVYVLLVGQLIWWRWFASGSRYSASGG